MKIERSVHLELPADEIFEMMCTPSFQEQKCINGGAVSYDVSVVRQGDGAVIKARRKLSTNGFPSLLRKFLPGSITSTETITWAGPVPDGSRSATLHVDFHGAPVSMNGTVRLVPDGAKAAHILVDADFKAHVPLVARKVEGFAAPIILGIIDAEEATGRTWAASAQG